MKKEVNNINLIDLENTLNLNKRLDFLIKLCDFEINKDEKFSLSEIFEKLGYEDLVHTDFRKIMNGLEYLKIIIPQGKNRYGRIEYKINQKELLKYIYNSKICESMQKIILLNKTFAVV